MLKHRILTVLCLLPLVILAILYLPGTWFYSLTLLLYAWCAWEWAFITDIKSKKMRVVFVLCMLAVSPLIFFIQLNFFFIVAGMMWIWAMLAVLCYAKNKSALGFEHKITQIIAGFFMLIPFLVAINALRHTNLGPKLLIVALLIVWAVDTGGYFVGRFFGKKLFMPRVSPKKTWEGFIGGMILALIVALIYALLNHMTWHAMLRFGILTLVMAWFSVIGDLFESMLKRLSQVKDSGAVLPGHGGLLDRLDSSIAALPIFSLGIFLSSTLS